jgi:hypothetical protein
LGQAKGGLRPESCLDLIQIFGIHPRAASTLLKLCRSGYHRNFGIFEGEPTEKTSSSPNLAPAKLGDTPKGRSLQALDRLDHNGPADGE